MPGLVIVPKSAVLPEQLAAWPVPVDVDKTKVWTFTPCNGSLPRRFIWGLFMALSYAPFAIWPGSNKMCVIAGDAAVMASQGAVPNWSTDGTLRVDRGVAHEDGCSRTPSRRNAMINATAAVRQPSATAPTVHPRRRPSPRSTEATRFVGWHASALGIGRLTMPSHHAVLEISSPQGFRGHAYPRFWAQIRVRSVTRRTIFAAEMRLTLNMTEHAQGY